MANTTGTLTDNTDGKIRSDMPQLSGTAVTDDSTAGKNSYNITVTGSENSTVGENIVTGVVNYTVNNNEKVQEGLACDVTEGEKPKLKISVPAEDGGTMIHVDCTNGKVRHWSYCRNVDIEKTFGSRWTFGNIFDGFMAAIINGKIGDDFFDLIGKWMERYGCKVYKVYKKCLVIEFLHETEEGRDRMIKEKETVKQMFQTFIEDNKPNAPSCTLEVSTEKETTPSSDKPDTELKHIEQDVSEDASEDMTSKSEQAQAQGMKPREYKKEKQFQSVSDDESEPPPKKEMEYSVESEALAEIQKQTEASHLSRMALRPYMYASSSADETGTGSSIDADETETSSPFDDLSRMGLISVLSAGIEADETETSSPFDTDETETSSPFDNLSLMGLKSVLSAGIVGMRWGSEMNLSDMAEGSMMSMAEGSMMSMAEGSMMSMAGGSRMSVGEETRSLFDSDEEETSSSFHYFGLQPIPVSHVHLCDCRRCSEVLRECENELSTLPNLFFIHFDPTLEDVRLNDSQLQFTKILSAFRNSQGGVLIVHQRKTSDSGLSLHKFINQILDSVLTHDLVTCDVFKSQQIGNYEDVFRIDVEPAEMYVTHDYKTKFPSLSTDKFENASNERIRHLLFSPRTTESTVPALKDISSRQQNVEELRLRGTRPIPMLSYTSKPPRHMLNVLVDDIDMDGIDVDDIMTSHSVAEHITSLSKKKSGGSMFVVMPGLKFDDTPLRQQERFKARLMQTLKKNLRVQKNKHSKVSLQDIDVFKIGLSKDADSGDCILEIAVGHVNGCVFYDSQGPESYKIEGEKIVRLPIERWVEEAFE